jgi:ERCC4-type nuclease
MKLKPNLNLAPAALKPFKIPTGLVIIIDTREQRPLFSTRPISHLPRLTTIRKKVEFGDYTIKGFEAEFAIERKQMSDFYSYIGKERKKTVKKMNEFKQIVTAGGFVGLVIEASEDDVLFGYVMSKVPPEVARQALVSFRIRYGVHVYFNRSRECIERWVLDTAIKFYKVRREVR